MSCMILYLSLNCGTATNVSRFSAKYQIRGSEEANRLWFHVLAQERAKVGREALKELYDDVLSIPQGDLKEQISEGFVASVRSGENLAETMAGFWGWAVVGLGDQLYVHMPLSSAVESEISLPETQPIIHQLHVGENTLLNLETPVVLVSDVPKLRGDLLLELQCSESPGIFLALSTTAPSDQKPTFEWVSSISSSGWRCRIRSHLWPEFSSTIAIWILVATDACQPRVTAQSAVVVFEEANYAGHEPCSAQLTFEEEVARLPAELHFSYAAFYAAYGAIDGRAIAEATQSENLELTYAEIEFVPFYELLAQVAQPQPGHFKQFCYVC